MKSNSVAAYLGESKSKALTEYEGIKFNSVNASAAPLRTVMPSRKLDAYLAAAVAAKTPSRPSIGLDSSEAFRNIDGGVCADDPNTFWAFDTAPLELPNVVRYIHGAKI